MTNTPKQNRQLNEEREAAENIMIRRRITVVMILIGVIAFIPLVLQLFNLMIVRHEELELRAVYQQTRDTVISPTRGSIMDRNNNILAMSASVETVFISPAEIESDQDARLIAQGLSSILEVDYNWILELSEDKESYYKVIKSKVDRSLADKVREFIKENDDIRGIYLEDDYKRYYPYGSFASNVIGFVTNDNLGAEGIEVEYNTDLQGTSGRITSTKSESGYDTPETDIKSYDAQNGLNIVLTIDDSVQKTIEEYLERAIEQYKVLERGTAIVMDIKTGQILGMAVAGDYDPNNPRDITDPLVLEKLESDELTEEEKGDLLVDAQYAQWRNKAVSDAYEPGSTFKIITTAAALEEQVVSLQDSFYCGGSVMVPGWKDPIECWKHSGHGAETFVEGVQNSCNVVFIAVGQRIGTQKFYQYMEAFGLFDKTGIDLPGESSGQALSFGEFDSNIVSLSVYAFGQTFTVTPIQLITAISAVANDGVLMKPYVVKEKTDSQGNVVYSASPTAVRQVISEETSDTVCDILESVVTEGTGGNAYVAGYRVGGKTGTGEKINLPEDEQVGNYVVSFIGVAPCDDPQVAVLVTLDHPSAGTISERSGGIMAAPIVGNIMSDILPYLGIEPKYTESEGALVDVYVPNCINKSESEAGEEIRSLGLTYDTVGDGDVVTAQIPSPNIKVPANSEIVLYMGVDKPTEKVEVPNLIGCDISEADSILKSRGLIMKATGATSSYNSVVFSQSLEAGTKVDLGTIVTIQLLNSSANDSGH